MYPGKDLDILSWSCLDKDGNAFNPNYNLPDNQYFTTKTIGLGSYALRKISTPLLTKVLYSPVGLTPLKNIH